MTRTSLLTELCLLRYLRYSKTKRKLRCRQTVISHNVFCLQGNTLWEICIYFWEKTNVYKKNAKQRIRLERRQQQRER